MGASGTVEANRCDFLSDQARIGAHGHLVRKIKQAMPHQLVILGGHTTHDHVTRRLAEADGVLVGAYLKTGRRDGRVGIESVRADVNIVASLGQL